MQYHYNSLDSLPVIFYSYYDHSQASDLIHLVHQVKAKMKFHAFLTLAPDGVTDHLHALDTLQTQKELPLPVGYGGTQSV
jgi:hypothetical protein